jgi:hypothetical protein
MPSLLQLIERKYITKIDKKEHTETEKKENT